MYHNFDTKYFNPDFYLVSPHSVGTLSTLYYLSLLGAPATQLKGTYEGGEKYPLTFPIQKSEYIYARGISCDRVLLDSRPLTYGSKNQKVIQLLRDPIDQLTSLINWFIYDSVQPTGCCCDITNCNSKLKFINYWLTLSVMPRSLRASVNTDSQTLYIGFNDLLADECEKTLCRICKYLNIPINIDQRIINKCKIPYNSSKNRCWAYSPKRAFTTSADRGAVLVSVYPSLVHDYYANYWQVAHPIDMFEYNGTEYTVSIDEKQLYSADGFLMNGFWDEEKRYAIKKSLDKFYTYNNVVEKLYNEQSMSWTDTIDTIRSNPKFRSRFLKLMDYEISPLIKEVPDIVNSWDHFHSL